MRLAPHPGSMLGDFSFLGGFTVRVTMLQRRDCATFLGGSQAPHSGSMLGDVSFSGAFTVRVTMLQCVGIVQLFLGVHTPVPFDTYGCCSFFIWASLAR